MTAWFLLLSLTVQPPGPASTPDDGVAEATQPFAVTGYLPSYRLGTWQPPKPCPLTDLVYFQVRPDDDGALEPAIDEATWEQVQATARQADARLSVCCGGWGHSDAFAAVMKDPARRRRLVDELAALPVQGVDFDWEHPRTSTEWTSYELTIRELKRRRPSWVVSVALASWNDAPASLFAAVDRVHLMSYDHAWPQATRELAESDLDAMLERGCPAAKLLLGLPFYGRDRERAAKAYASLPVLPDEVDVTDEGMAFNNRDTIAAKVQLARRRGLGGVMIWEVGQDRTDERALLPVIGETLRQPSTQRQQSTTRQSFR